MRIRTSFIAFFCTPAAALLLAPSVAQACAVCYGDPNSELTKAMGPGILFLLLCIGMVLSAFAGLFGYWALRMKRLNEDGVTT